MATIDQCEKVMRDIESVSRFLSNEQNEAVRTHDEKRSVMIYMMEQSFLDMVTRYQSYVRYIRQS